MEKKNHTANLSTWIKIIVTDIISRSQRSLGQKKFAVHVP